MTGTWSLARADWDGGAPS